MNIGKNLIACSARSFNAGGNTLIVEVPVMFGSDLRLVTISDDCIVGRSADEADYDSRIDELFVTDSWLELCKIVGSNNATAIYDRYKDRWPYNSGIKDEAKLIAVKRLMEFADATTLLSDCWHTILDDAPHEYPLAVSFDEFASQVFDWQYRLLQYVEEPQPSAEDEKKMREYYGNDN